MTVVLLTSRYGPVQMPLLRGMVPIGKYRVQHQLCCLIKDGTILNKWSDNQLPDEYVLNDSLDKLELGQQKQENKLHTIGYVLLWFIVPLTLVVGIDILIIKRRERKSRERQAAQSSDNR